MADRPSTISIKDLSAAVDQAVKIVTEKYKTKFSQQLRIGPGTIIGRQLLETDIGLKQAEQIASDITQHVASSAVATNVTQKFEPVVLIRSGGGGTTCGMICPTDIELQ